MRILAINCGSSSVKLTLADVSAEAKLLNDYAEIARGQAENIGQGGISLRVATQAGVYAEDLPGHDQRDAIRKLIEITASDVMEKGGVEAIGCRIVHGGALLERPVLASEAVLSDIRRAGELAPIHNASALAAIEAARDVFRPGIPVVVTFDTAFYADMPKVASSYAIPKDLGARYGIKRFGFHGLAHRYMATRFCELTGIPLHRSRLVTFQLGSGSSVTAIENGVPADTSMGFTPLEGLVMATRSGDIDPSVVPYLAERASIPTSEVLHRLNSRSGLLGVSGISGDARRLIEARKAGNQDATFALELFCYRARKYLGAYLAVLGGADAVIFGGGIGENAASIRAQICEGLTWCGLEIDTTANEKAIDKEMLITTNDSRIAGYVIPVNEAAIIFSDTVDCLRSAS